LPVLLFTNNTAERYRANFVKFCQRDDITQSSDVGGQMPAAAAAMLGNYGPMLAYSPAAGHPSAIMSAAGTILLAAAPPGSATPACTVLLVSNLNEEVRVLYC